MEKNLDEIKPDKYHRHQALHMALFIGESVSTQIVDKAYIRTNQEGLALAEKAREALLDFHQLLGSKIGEPLD